MKKWTSVLAFGLAGAMIATPGLLVVPALAQSGGSGAGGGGNTTGPQMPGATQPGTSGTTSSGSETGTSATNGVKSGGTKSGTMMKSDKMRGAAGRMSSTEVKSIQQALKDKGHDPGTIDGVMGPKTHAALREFQKAEGLQPTGRPTQETLAKLGVSGASSGMGTTTPSASPSTGTSGSSSTPSATGSGSTGGSTGGNGSGTTGATGSSGSTTGK
jgi:peptidoglycan hydrolase-like protein with peptidoglycan-binding domain